MFGLLFSFIWTLCLWPVRLFPLKRVPPFRDWVSDSLAFYDAWVKMLPLDRIPLAVPLARLLTGCWIFLTTFFGSSIRIIGASGSHLTLCIGSFYSEYPYTLSSRLLCWPPVMPPGVHPSYDIADAVPDYLFLVKIDIFLVSVGGSISLASILALFS